MGPVHVYSVCRRRANSFIDSFREEEARSSDHRRSGRARESERDDKQLPPFQRQPPTGRVQKHIIRCYFASWCWFSYDVGSNSRNTSSGTGSPGRTKGCLKSHHESWFDLWWGLDDWMIHGRKRSFLVLLRIYRWLALVINPRIFRWERKTDLK